jgi:hypothetical protein
VAVCAGLLTWPLACSPEGQASGEGGGGAAGGPNTGSGGEVERAEEAVVTAILTRGPDDTYLTYLMAGEEAPEGTIDRSGARELPDALVADNGEAIFVGDNERITLQRYEVNADYTFEMVGEFSLQGYGVDYISNDPLFFSSTSAYYVDAPRGQIITFDPSTMTITGDIQVPELLRDDYFAWMGPPQKDGDRYLAPILYTDADWTATAPDSTVAIITSDEDEPIRLIQDDRGVGAYLSFVADDGHFYFAADGLSGNLALAGLQDVPTSRVLRVKSGEEQIDPSYLLDLGELLDTPGTFGFWPVSGSAFVTQAWASDVDPADVLEPGTGGWGQPYFDWKFVDLETMEARPVDGLERSGPYNTLRLRLDGDTYVQRFVDGVERAELYLLNPNASAEKVAETTLGDFWFLGRVTPAR